MSKLSGMFGSRCWLPLLLAGLLACSGSLRAADSEDYDLGFKRYQEGDVVGAMAPLRKAANTGHVKAMVLLAQILDASEFDEEAVGFFRKAAEQGDPDGMFGLGAMTASGEGMKNKDQVAGRAWILKAAESGHVQAVNVIAQAYLKAEMGLTEADRSTPEALRWVQAAAKNDYLPAVDALADAYRTGGTLGVSVNAALADEYWTQSNKIRRIEPGKGKKRAKKPAGAPAAAY